MRVHSRHRHPPLFVVQILKRRVWPILRRPSPPIENLLRDVQIQDLNRGWTPRTSPLSAGQTPMTCDVYRGSSGTSQTQRHSIRLSDWPGRSDDSLTESTPISLTVPLFLHSRHVLVPLYPGSRDRAYYSGRAMVWINTLARCKSEDFPYMLPLSPTKHEGRSLDPDLRHLLRVNRNAWNDNGHLLQLLAVDSGYTSSHTMDLGCVITSFLGGSVRTGL